MFEQWSPLNRRMGCNDFMRSVLTVCMLAMCTFGVFISVAGRFACLAQTDIRLYPGIGLGNPNRSVWPAEQLRIFAIVASLSSSRFRQFS